MLASHDADAQQQSIFSEQEQRALIHETMDRHLSRHARSTCPRHSETNPRAPRSDRKRARESRDWLKMMENQTAMAGESTVRCELQFDCMWTELGIAG